MSPIGEANVGMAMARYALMELIYFHKLPFNMVYSRRGICQDTHKTAAW